MQVELYARRGSAESDAARAVLERVRAKLPFELINVDIDLDPKLRERFERDAPVVYVAGRRAFRHAVDEAQLVLKVERARAFAMGSAASIPDVGHSAKLGFAALALLAVAFVFGREAYRRLVVEPELEIQALEVESESFAAPAFSLTDEKGAKHALADYRGQVVLLNFWASWCAPCREEIPDLGRLALELGPHRDFVMLAVSVDDGWPAVQDFFKDRYGSVTPPYTVLLDPGGKVSAAYGTTKFPETYVIDPQGRAVAKFVGAREWAAGPAKRYLEKLLR